MAEISDEVKQQAYDVTPAIRENIAQVEQYGHTSPYGLRGQMSPQIEDRLNSYTRDYYDSFNTGPEQQRDGPDSGFGPGKG